MRALAGVLLAMAAEAAQQLRDVDLVAPRHPAGEEADSPVYTFRLLYRHPFN